MALSNRFLTVLTIVLFSLFAGLSKSLAAYPEKPITIIIPWGAGGGTDILVRSMVPFLEKEYPYGVKIVNKPGAGGTIGTTIAVHSPPDGYTVCINGWGPFVTQPSLKHLKYSTKDYIPVMQLSKIPRILVAHPSAPFNNMKEMVAYAKANPGKLKIGVSAIGTTGHLSMAKIEQDYDVKFDIQTFGGGVTQKIAIIGGKVLASPIKGSEGGIYSDTGKLKPLGMMCTERWSQLFNIPTLMEQGYDIKSCVIFYLTVPAGTSSDRVAWLHDFFKNVLDNPGYRALSQVKNIGIAYKSGKEAKADIIRFKKMFRKVIMKLGIGKNKLSVK